MQTRLLRGLSGARHPDGDHVERGGRDGRSSAPDRSERDLPAAADERAPGCRRDHEAGAPSHPAEQDRPRARERGAQPARTYSSSLKVQPPLTFTHLYCTYFNISCITVKIPTV